MIRIAIENALLFLLPAALYVAYVMLMRDDHQSAGSLLNDAPLVWLFAAGALLVLITLIVFGSTSGGRPGQGYVPPVLKDGRIEPGHIIK